MFRVDPRELIVAEPVFYDPELKPVFDVLGRVASPQPPSCSIRRRPPARIARFFEVATPDSFGTFSRAELSAVSGIIAYVEKTQKAERPPLSRAEREEQGASCSSTRRRAPIWSCCARCPAAAKARCSRRSTAR